MGPFVGWGSQATTTYRRQKFWASETPALFRARETDGDNMIGTTDKDPVEKVWYELEFVDILRGATILSASPSAMGVTIYAQEASDTAVRLLVGNGETGQTGEARVDLVCSDGSVRKRTLKVRGRKL